MIQKELKAALKSWLWGAGIQIYDPPQLAASDLGAALRMIGLPLLSTLVNDSRHGAPM